MDREKEPLLSLGDRYAVFVPPVRLLLQAAKRRPEGLRATPDKSLGRTAGSGLGPHSHKAPSHRSPFPKAPRAGSVPTQHTVLLLALKERMRERQRNR